MGRMTQDVGEAIKDLRTYLNESQETFAKRLAATVRTVARWEKGQPPSLRMLVKLERRLAAEKGGAGHANLFRFAFRDTITAYRDMDMKQFV